LDLFPDNVFINQSRIDGVIDFYFSAHTLLLYDLAIVINAWCFDRFHDFDPDLFQALVAGYQTKRQLSLPEQQAFQVVARGAACRFYLSRQHDMIFGAKQALVTPKDPNEYLKKLTFHQHNRVF
jgi:homoserine kinase type II